MSWEMLPEVCWRVSRVQKVRFRGLKGQFDAKKVNFKKSRIKNLRLVKDSGRGIM